MKNRFKIVGLNGGVYNGSGKCYLRDTKQDGIIPWLVGVKGMDGNDKPVPHAAPFPSRHAARRWVTAYNKAKGTPKAVYALWQGSSGWWYSDRFKGKVPVVSQASYVEGHKTNRDDVIRWTESQPDFGGWVKVYPTHIQVPFPWPTRVKYRLRPASVSPHGSWYADRHPYTNNDGQIRTAVSWHETDGDVKTRDGVITWAESQPDFGGWDREVDFYKRPLNTVSYIHVLKAQVGQNKLNNTDNPVVRVVHPDGRESLHHEVKINGPSRVVYSRDRTCPGAPGVECWIEANDGDIEVVR